MLHTVPLTEIKFVGTFIYLFIYPVLCVVFL